jgi:S1-C subfamily serine protease
VRLPLSLALFAFSAFALAQPSPSPSPSPAASPSPLAEARHLDAKGVFGAATGLVFQLKTSVGSATGAKAAYGTAFVVRSDGLLATNYHVVMRAVTQPEKYRVYLVDADPAARGTALEAKVVAVNAVHDLALVRVETRFPSALELAPGALASGERLYSIGMPADLNMSVVEGNFNGLNSVGPYERMQLSSPINPGMSGGPTLDEDARIVGVNVALLSGAQNISFAVPGRFLETMLKQAGEPGRAPATAADPGFEQALHEQLEDAQDRLAREWLEKPGTPVQLGRWQAVAPPASVKCWRERETKNEIRQEVESCKFLFNATPREGLTAGSYVVSYSAASSKTMGAAGFFRWLDEVYNRSTDSAGIRLAKAHGQLTPKSCGEKIVVNRHDIPIKVNFCFSGFRKYGNLDEASVKLATLLPESDALVLNLSLHGFAPANVRSLVGMLADGIERLKDENRAPAEEKP